MIKRMGITAGHLLAAADWLIPDKPGWLSSAVSVHQRAVTIECASDMSEPYAMNSAVYDSLVKLCTDICKRNGKAPVAWRQDKDAELRTAV